MAHGDRDGEARILTQRRSPVRDAVLELDLARAFRELLARADTLLGHQALHGLGRERELAERPLETRIYEGTSEILHSGIARDVLRRGG